METKIKYLIYLRKSTDSEERQVNSIEDQKKELQKVVSHFKLDVKGIYQESQSAKKPGRPEFNRMMSEIKKGKANGILCWKLNRLARNPVDGGEIMWLVQQGVIQSIQTPGKEYKVGDNMIVMSVELGMANQYILDLSKDVSRGMLGKAESGWRPGRAPLGYKNDKGGDQGNKIIHKDEEKFPIVRKMWDLMLTGDYSVPRIIDIANNEWGLRTDWQKQERKLHESHGYSIFTNKFYYGEYDWKEKIYQGKHQPMITQVEFDYVQRFLGNKAKPQTRHKNLPYRGTIRCGECGCYITAELKTKRIKSENIIKTYIYHHCTNKKIDIDCHQKSIRFEEINRQVEEKLARIALPESFLSFALKILSRDNELEVDNRNLMIKSQQKALRDCQDRIDNLLKVYIAPANSNKELLTDEEFKTQKSSLLKEKAEIEQQLDNLSQRVDEWLELTEKTFKFAIYAKENFNSGDYETKTRILRALGSNFVLKDGKVDITLRKQYQLIENALESIKVKNPRLELTDFALSQTKTAHSKAVFETMSG